MDDDLELESKIRLLAEKISSARRIAFLTGAGISTDSGIPDFRSTSGIYKTTSEEMFSIDFFRSDPTAFYKMFAPFYCGIKDSKPNSGHNAIVELERRCGKKVDVVTQNIDTLHSAAGSSRVAEIHGTLRTATCLTCEKTYKSERFDAAMRAGVTPYCDCGGVLKPDVTFFGEELPARAYIQAQQAMWETKLLIVVGTSLQVYPAAGLPRLCDAGAPFVVINKTPTQLDRQASLVFHEEIAKVLPVAVALVPDRVENDRNEL